MVGVVFAPLTSVSACVCVVQLWHHRILLWDISKTALMSNAITDSILVALKQKGVSERRSIQIAEYVAGVVDPSDSNNRILDACRGRWEDNHRSLPTWGEIEPHVRETLEKIERQKRYHVSDPSKHAEMTKYIKDRGFVASLKDPHQPAGVRFLVRNTQNNRRGCILADGMGLGKTVQLLASVCADRGNSPHPTIIVGLKAIIPQWARETARHTDIRNFAVYTGPKKERIGRYPNYDALRGMALVFTTYDIVRYEFNSRASPLFPWGVPRDQDRPMFPDGEWVDGQVSPRARHYWRGLILDEAHKIRNIKSRTTGAILALSRLSDFVHCASGTPFNNKIDDISTLCHLIGEGSYGSPVWWKQNMDNAPALSDWRGRYLMLRGKEVIADQLPPLRRVVDSFQMSDTEWKFYKDMVGNLFTAMAAFEKRRLNFTGVLVQLLRIRQSTNHPMLFMGRGETLRFTTLAKKPNTLAPVCCMCGKGNTQESHPADEEIDDEPPPPPPLRRRPRPFIVCRVHTITHARTARGVWPTRQNASAAHFEQNGPDPPKAQNCQGWCGT
jgi:SNF2 family DNA or RNA helicase